MSEGTSLMAIERAVILLIIDDHRTGELELIFDAFVELQDEFVLANYFVD